MNANTKRERLIDSAATLFHTKGLLSTSLADIAKHAEIPIGNVYYYFKTKDELAHAAIEKRRKAMAELYAHLEQATPDPRERLTQLVRFFERVKQEYARFGCPIYRLIMDGGEHDKEGVSAAAARVYGEFVEWTEGQFRSLGQADHARKHAVALLGGIQGGAAMAKAFQNAEALAEEIERLAAWVASLPNKKIFLGKAGSKKIEAM